jgi:hypothetical protein
VEQQDLDQPAIWPAADVVIDTPSALEEVPAGAVTVSSPACAF